MVKRRRPKVPLASDLHGHSCSAQPDVLEAWSSVSFARPMLLTVRAWLKDPELRTVPWDYDDLRNLQVFAMQNKTKKSSALTKKVTIREDPVRPILTLAS